MELASQEKKKLQVLPGDSISYEDLHQARDNPGPVPKNKKRRIVSSSSSDGSDIMDLIDRSDSGSEEYTSDDSDGNGDNLHAVKAVADEPEGDQASYNVGDFVLVMFENNRFPDRIIATSDKGTKVDCMEKTSKKWRWPTKKDCIDYEWHDVIGKIKQQYYVNVIFFGFQTLRNLFENIGTYLYF